MEQIRKAKLNIWSITYLLSYWIECDEKNTFPFTKWTNDCEDEIQFEQSFSSFFFFFLAKHMLNFTFIDMNIEQTGEHRIVDRHNAAMRSVLNRSYLIDERVSSTNLMVSKQIGNYLIPIYSFWHFVCALHKSFIFSTCSASIYICHSHTYVLYYCIYLPHRRK